MLNYQSDSWTMRKKHEQACLNECFLRIGRWGILRMHRTDSKRSGEEGMSCKIDKNLPVVMRLWDTPVPIPNTMVKT